MAVSDDPDNFEDAIKAFRARVPMTDTEYAALEEDARKRAFYVSEVTRADVISQVWSSIDKAIEEGTDFEDFADEVEPALTEAWGQDDPARLETVFRTNVMGAYNQGRMNLINDPVVKELRPYWRFDAIEDDRISDICEEAAGTVLPADDPFWLSHTPPLHFNCRSIITPLDPEEAAAEGIDEEAPSVEADGDFGSLDSDLNDYKPDLGSYPPELREKIKGTFEDD